MNFSLKQNSGLHSFLCCISMLLISSIVVHAQIPFEKTTQQGNGLRAGAAAVKITPPVGSIMGMSYGLTVSFNRRYLLKDGTVKMNPGRRNPDIVRPAGPVDPDLSIVLFESSETKPVAIIVNYALHVAVVGGNRFSADFPGIVSSLLSKVYGKEMVTMYTNGTSGNINHIDVTRKNQLDGYAESERIGTILAADVMKALPSLRPIKVNNIRVHTEAVQLPIQQVRPDEVKWAREVLTRFGKPSAPPFFDVVKAWKILDLAALKGGVQPGSSTTVPLTRDGAALESEVGC
jgi:neutral ceramidase